MPDLRQARLVLPLCLLSALIFAHQSQGQKAQTPVPPKKPTATALPAPASTHYPILLLAQGNNPTWSLRIGQKGPERLDRPNYPPITLDPVDVTREGAADSWSYNAKDDGTSAAVAIHLTREPCVDPSSGTKYAFRVIVRHEQLGELTGCARIAAELFPKIVNPANQADDDDDAAKKKPPESTVTNFKSPVAVAYINPTGKVVVSNGTVKKVVAPEGSDLALSRDGKRLLYTRQGQGGDSVIVLYDFPTGKSIDLVADRARAAFWSPDDTRFAFLRLVNGGWQLFIAPISTPGDAASPYSGEIASIHGWTDAHSILVDDRQQLLWVGDDGSVRPAVSEKDLFDDAFNGAPNADAVRVNPINPDLLLVSTTWAIGGPENQHAGLGLGAFLYEIHSGRRVLFKLPGGQNAEWSRDGLQIFFTGANSSGHFATIWRIFWDGTGLKRYLDGTHMVIGQ